MSPSIILLAPIRAFRSVCFLLGTGCVVKNSLGKLRTRFRRPVSPDRIFTEFFYWGVSFGFFVVAGLVEIQELLIFRTYLIKINSSSVFVTILIEVLRNSLFLGRSFSNLFVQKFLHLTVPILMERLFTVLFLFVIPSERILTVYNRLLIDDFVVRIGP